MLQGTVEQIAVELDHVVLRARFEVLTQAFFKDIVPSRSWHFDVYAYGGRLTGHERNFPEHGKTTQDEMPRIGFAWPRELVNQFRRTAFGDDFYFARLMQ